VIAERVLTTTEREVSELDTLPRRRFTVEEYEQLVQVGILADDERVELLEGELIEMSPINL
jgi:Uma2 family endonuclease